MKKSIATLSYAAGIMDGEGSILISRRNMNHSRIIVKMTNTNEWLVRWFSMQFGGQVYISHDNRRNPNAKDGFAWRATASEAHIILQQLLPYLKIKKPQAELAISFQRRRLKPGRPKTGKLPVELLQQDENDRLLMARYNHRGK